MDIELPPQIAAQFGVGHRFNVFYDRAHPTRLLHPWPLLLWDHFWRAIAGIVIFGLLWWGFIVWTRN
jgi:hypothetical protein